MISVTTRSYFAVAGLLVCACAGGGGGEKPASTGSVAGIWDGPIAAEERSGDRLRNVLQFDPPTEAGTSGRYGIFGESLSGPLYGNRPWLALAQEGTWHVEDDHVVFAAKTGELTANEILSFTGNSLTLESVATQSGDLSYQRTTSCPDPVEREGWSLTTRALMANDIQGGGLGGGATVAVDSTGRAHVVAGGESLAYFTRQEGCFWKAYSFGPAEARGQLLITPDDILHVVGTSLHGFFHFSAPASTAANSSAS